MYLGGTSRCTEEDFRRVECEVVRAVLPDAGATSSWLCAMVVEDEVVGGKGF
jgi:hypothetical protein